MAEPDDDLRIRKGLKFLKHQDRSAIRASIILQKLLRVEDPDLPEDLMARRTFHDVEGTTYRGWMTDEQFSYLNDCMESKKAFADAIAVVIMKLDDKFRHAVRDIEQAMNMVDNAKKAMSVAPDPVPSGCCTYDSGLMAPCSKAACEGGLLGDWVMAPCPPREDKKTRPSR